MAYSKMQTIRYMGNKNRLLNEIIPEIEKITAPGDTICDLMAGTNAVGYALKNRNIIISNDIQYYSFVVSHFLLDNVNYPLSDEVHDQIDRHFEKNIKDSEFSFFVDNYSETYFSTMQCAEIDSLRYAISKVEEKHRYAYLVALMNAMCKAQSSPGHFAQYLDKSNKRVASLRKQSINELFYDKVADFSSVNKSDYENICLNMDYKRLLDEEGIMKKVDCFYLDSPYTSDQYSRFYHILETVCKYDFPKLSFKARYREDRQRSNFCYKGSVTSEFKNIIEFAFKNNSNLVISYSNRGVLGQESLMEICAGIYPKVKVKEIQYKHSSQGKGPVGVKELLFILEV